jgi:hypothetical protein
MEKSMTVSKKFSFIIYFLDACFLFSETRKREKVVDDSLSINEVIEVSFMLCTFISVQLLGGKRERDTKLKIVQQNEHIPVKPFYKALRQLPNAMSLG